MDFLRFLVLASALALPGLAQASEWSLEDGSAIRFEAYQQGQPVGGGFDRFSADITFDPDDLAAARIEVEIDTASISTGHADRDTALRSKDLFDVEQWPTAGFSSTSVEHLGGENYQATGQLTIRDVQKEVVVPFTLTIAEHANDPSLQWAQVEGGLSIMRLDYGVGQGDWQSTAAVADEVLVKIAIFANAPR